MRLCLAGLALALAGCVGADPGPVAYGGASFSPTAPYAGAGDCAQLFAAERFARLAGKMPVFPGQMPDRAMLGLDAAPDARDIADIQSLEGAMRTCRQLRAAAGVTTSATEDILNARISKLRYGLYHGDISYAVYNYGVARALDSYNRFLLEGERAAQRGRKAGEERNVQALMLGRYSMLNTLLTTYERRAGGNRPPPDWTCTPTAMFDGTTYVDCY